MASRYIKDYRERKHSLRTILKAHKKGFSVGDWVLMGLNQSNYQEYLSTATYYGLHPINGSFSKWIDDKLTLKYLCVGTQLDSYMPEYYYQINAKGLLINLPDCPSDLEEKDWEGFLEFLKIKKVLAFKPIADSLGHGFLKIEFKGSSFFINSVKISKDELLLALNELKNYLVTEYLLSHETFSKVYPSSLNTVRYLAGRIGGKFEFIKSYVRFGTSKSGSVDNYGAGGVLCLVDRNGHYREGNILNLDGTNTKGILVHPDTQRALNGIVPHWDEIKNVIEMFGITFPQLNYLGFDFAITADQKVKIIEINSLNSLAGIQLDQSIFKISSGDFYKQRLNSAKL